MTLPRNDENALQWNLLQAPQLWTTTCTWSYTTMSKQTLNIHNSYISFESFPWNKCCIQYGNAIQCRISGRGRSCIIQFLCKRLQSHGRNTNSKKGPSHPQVYFLAILSLGGAFIHPELESSLGSLIACCLNPLPPAGWYIRISVHTL